MGQADSRLFAGPAAADEFFRRLRGTDGGRSGVAGEGPRGDGGAYCGGRFDAATGRRAKLKAPPPAARSRRRKHCKRYPPPPGDTVEQEEPGQSAAPAATDTSGAAAPFSLTARLCGADGTAVTLAAPEETAAVARGWGRDEVRTLEIDFALTEGTQPAPFDGRAASGAGVCARRPPHRGCAGACGGGLYSLHIAGRLYRRCHRRDAALHPGRDGAVGAALSARAHRRGAVEQAARRGADGGSRHGRLDGGGADRDPRPGAGLGGGAGESVQRLRLDGRRPDGEKASG